MNEDKMPDVADMLDELRGWADREAEEVGDEGYSAATLREAIALLESLSARVTQAETELAQAKHDAWAEGHAAPADSGRWINDKPRKGMRQWEKVPEPNPYPTHSSPVPETRQANEQDRSSHG